MRDSLLSLCWVLSCSGIAGHVQYHDAHVPSVWCVSPSVFQNQSYILNPSAKHGHVVFKCYANSKQNMNLYRQLNIIKTLVKIMLLPNSKMPRCCPNITIHICRLAGKCALHVMWKKIGVFWCVIIIFFHLNFDNKKIVGIHFASQHRCL